MLTLLLSNQYTKNPRVSKMSTFAAVNQNGIKTNTFRYCGNKVQMIRPLGAVRKKLVQLGSRTAGLGGDRDRNNSNNVTFFVTNAKIAIFWHQIAKL
jgi:hypothetical protein